MTIAETKLIEVLKAILKAYETDPEFLYLDIQRARKLIAALDPDA